MFFKFKDVFTLLNILLALYAVVLAMEGHIEWASLLVLLNWVVDGLDGLVARLTKSTNVFGAKFDDLADLFAFSVTPGMLAYAVYRPYQALLAIFLCMVIISVGTIRLARNQAEPLNIPEFWIGFPRPAFAIFIISLLNSHLFLDLELWVPGAAAILCVGALSLTQIPYISNKTKFGPFQILLIVTVPITSVITYFLGFMWDQGIFWIVIYIFIPWFGMKAETRARVKARIQTAQNKPTP